MAMVAVGGSIGTGLLLGSAAAMQIAGPGVILSFALAAFIVLGRWLEQRFDFLIRERPELPA